MNTRTGRLLGWVMFTASGILCALAAVFLVVGWRTPVLPTEFGPKGYAIAWSLVVGGVGAVIASRRPSNPIGWILCGMGLLAGMIAAAVEYARWALIQESGGPPGGLYAAWIVEWIWIPLLACFALIAAIFPDGRFLSRRWRWVTLVAFAATIIPTALNLLIPRFTTFAGFDNPLGVRGKVVADAAGASLQLLIPMLVVGAAATVRRFRRSRGDERQQLKWLALANGLVALTFGVYGTLVVVQGTTSPTGPGLHWLEYLIVIAFLAVPVAIGFGVLKYRLYDIDVVITKTVVYGVLAAFITGIYLLVVVAVGSLTGYASNPVLSAIAAAIVALAFQPLRRRAQRLANRIVYGKRATPYEVLSELSSRFASEYSIDEALPRLSRVTGEAVGAERATVWLQSDGVLRSASSWPSQDGPIATIWMDGGRLPGFGPRETAFPVRHRGDVLGAISVVMPHDEPLGPNEAKLLEDVAAQAGLVVRNVRLFDELRESRRRIVTAQDERARTLERNIHDGAQQQLVALAVKQRLVESLVGRDDDRARAMLEELQTDATEALENLRDLARGIYPPLLADQGLPAALEAQARKAAVPTHVDADGIGRYAQDVEAAIYFSCLEALQNTAKYAHASAASISLRLVDGELRFEVRDDGQGFDTAVVTHGAGMHGIVDRLDAIGGRVEIRSAPGAGTTVSGTVPIDRTSAPGS
jgi:signal transduction histidine kinase